MVRSMAVVPMGALVADVEVSREVSDAGSRYWTPSRITTEYLREKDGVLPVAGVCFWRAAEGAVVPNPV